MKAPVLKAVAVVAALGVVLSGCATTKPAVVAVAPPPPAAPRPVLAPALPGPWHIVKTAWTKADEDGFGEFVREIAESGCTTTVACMQSAANFYHDTDPPTLQFHADCAKWAYMLRAYYASKNGLPFSYVSKIAGSGEDLRFTATSNTALERHDVVDTGTGIDTVATLKAIHDSVWTATYRMDPAVEAPVLQDFYSPKIAPGSIHPGTAIYDIEGHVMLVYDVTADGSILYMDAHPDESVTHGVYGPHVPASAAALGGGFKNFRPLKLVGATLRADGSYIGGQVVLAENETIADYSLEQYQGNAVPPKAADPRLAFRYNNASLDLYEYTRAAMSKGGFAYNPVYELEVTMPTLCSDAVADTRESRARVQTGLATLYADLAKNADLWKQRDLRVLYHGLSLKQTLAETYAAQANACVAADTGERPLDPFVRVYDVQTLISRIDESAPFAGMRPVGY